MGGMPQRVREAYERGDHEALRRMREKATKTRAKNRQRRLAQKAKKKAEDEAAQEWYEERRRLEALQIARARHDHYLPEEDQLPF